MAIDVLMRGFWSGRRVMVTGHMGFKGSWLTYLLSRFGAHTIGFGWDDRPDPLLYRRLKIVAHHHVPGDVLDLAALGAAMREHKVDTVFHLAARSLVIEGYRRPLETLRDNILGTATVLEALRECPGVQAAVMVTSDKVYANQGPVRPYREDDPLGGDDPYSASKGAAEIVIRAMRESYLGPGSGLARVASVRAGNVIGGGDWADHRLLPDAARACSTGQTLIVRHPDAVRPWQHVLEPLTGYLLAARLLIESGDTGRSSAWNFGPPPDEALPVREVADRFTRAWGAGSRWAPAESTSGFKEAPVLTIDSSRARTELSWRPRWRVDEAIDRTARWYRDFYAGADPGALLDADIDAYFGEASASRNAS